MAAEALNLTTNEGRQIQANSCIQRDLRKKLENLANISAGPNACTQLSSAKMPYKLAFRWCAQNWQRWGCWQTAGCSVSRYVIT
eukprot:1150900-Pelagomonas_calceolata.AAC.1